MSADKDNERFKLIKSLDLHGYHWCESCLLLNQWSKLVKEEGRWGTKNVCVETKDMFDVYLELLIWKENLNEYWRLSLHLKSRLSLLIWSLRKDRTQIALSLLLTDPVALTKHLLGRETPIVPTLETNTEVSPFMISIHPLKERIFSVNFLLFLSTLITSMIYC